MAADTLGSYGSLARYVDLERVIKVRLCPESINISEERLSFRGQSLISQLPVGQLG